MLERNSTMIKRPWLIQRCIVDLVKFKYDHMGSSEFEFDDQAKSIKRILATSFTGFTTNIVMFQDKLLVFVVAGSDFKIDEYQPYLQAMADFNTPFQLQELIYFDQAAVEAAGACVNDRSKKEINVWFDFENDVFWTLSEINQNWIIQHLHRVKAIWAKVKINRPHPSG